MAEGRVYISRDVIFDENVYLFAALHPNAGARLRSEILLLPESMRNVSYGDDNISTSYGTSSFPADATNNTMYADTITEEFV
jgi:hypothetical protein